MPRTPRPSHPPESRRRRYPWLVIPLSLSVVLVPLAADVDLDTIATVMLLVFAAGVGWFLWRHK
jgi:hypothetical protein